MKLWRLLRTCEDLLSTREPFGDVANLVLDEHPEAPRQRLLLDSAYHYYGTQDLESIFYENRADEISGDTDWSVDADRNQLLRSLSEGSPQMKKLLIAVAASLLLTISCAPSDQPPPAAQATPTAASDRITEMDFESGEVEQPAANSEESEVQPTPEVP